MLDEAAEGALEGVGEDAFEEITLEFHQDCMLDLLDENSDEKRDEGAEGSLVVVSALLLEGADELV